MKPTPSLKKIVLEVICLLYILLFVYAAVSKLIDFQNFRTQLGQSPLISVFADWIAIGIPVLELVIAIALCLPKYKHVGLYTGFGLMVMFTCYIYMILHYSPFVPCSCGGILENMNWREHFIFNSIVAFLGGAGILLAVPYKKSLFSLFFSGFAGIVLVGLSYVFSDAMIRKENPFIRQFTRIPFEKSIEADLQNPHFYFAGSDEGKIYLGNNESPLHMLSYDKNLSKRTDFKIHLDRDGFPFRAIQIHVDSANFYLWDGMVPVIFKGSIHDRQGKLIYNGTDFFTKALPMGNGRMALRVQKPPKGEHIMAVFNPENSIIKRDNFLEKQLDGIFDTEGTLQYSKELKLFVYTYYYRNQFIVADSLLNVKFRGNTIDTTTMADLKIVKIKKSGDTKLAKPPVTVNKNTSVYGSLLFVNSGLMGRFETKKVWDQASIIDVYDIVKNEYVTSFYIYNIHQEKMRAFMATAEGLYSLSGNSMQFHQWSPTIKKIVKKENIQNSTGR